MSAPVVPVNVQVPSDPTAPVVADLTVHAIRVAHIWRRDVERLPVDDWNVPGIYVLPAAAETPHAYVGKAVELRGRLLQHRSRPKLDWRRAVAIKRDTSHGFNSAEIGYLEGRAASELRAIPGLKVVEGQQTQDETLPPHLLLALDELIPSVLAALRLLGVDLFKPPDEDEDDEPGSPGVKKTHIVKAGTVADPSPPVCCRQAQSLTLARAEPPLGDRSLRQARSSSPASPTAPRARPPRPRSGSHHPTVGRRGTSATSTVRRSITCAHKWDRPPHRATRSARQKGAARRRRKLGKRPEPPRVLDSSAPAPLDQRERQLRSYSHE